MTPPTFTELVTLVTDFMADYAVYLAAGIVITLMTLGVRKLIRAGR